MIGLRQHGRLAALFSRGEPELQQRRPRDCRAVGSVAGATVADNVFLATGFCENKDLVILGLSLANWSFLAYAAMLVGSAALFLSPWNERKSS